MQQDTLSAQVIRYLLGLISARQLKVDDLVPSEISVAETLQVSRGIVREAYRALASLGILAVQSGKRPRIAAMDPSVLAQFFAYSAATSQINAQQILDLRRVIEVQSAALASINGSDEDLRRIREAGQRLHDLPVSAPDWIACDYALHMEIAAAVHNPLFQIVTSALRTPLEESMRAGLESQIDNHTEDQIVVLHDRIVDCISQRDSIGASKAMEEHFNAPVSSLLSQGVNAINARSDTGRNV